jgi:hypothetical protein
MGRVTRYNAIRMKEKLWGEEENGMLRFHDAFCKMRNSSSVKNQAADDRWSVSENILGAV